MNRSESNAAPRRRRRPARRKVTGTALGLPLRFGRRQGDGDPSEVHFVGRAG